MKTLGISKFCLPCHILVSNNTNLSMYPLSVEKHAYGHWTGLLYSAVLTSSQLKLIYYLSMYPLSMVKYFYGQVYYILPCQISMSKISYISMYPLSMVKHSYEKVHYSLYCHIFV